MNEPQWVIVKATFAPTGQAEPVAKFGDPIVLPDVQTMLVELGWLDPTVGGQFRAEVERLGVALELARENLVEIRRERDAMRTVVEAVRELDTDLFESLIVDVVSDPTMPANKREFYQAALGRIRGLDVAVDALTDATPAPAPTEVDDRWYVMHRHGDEIAHAHHVGYGHMGSVVNREHDGVATQSWAEARADWTKKDTQ